MTPEVFIELVSNYAVFGLEVIGGCSVVVALLAKVAKITPTDKDDLALSKAKRWIAALSSVLSKLALNNPKKPNP